MNSILKFLLRGRALTVCAAIWAAHASSGIAVAQQSAANIEVLQLRPNLYLIAGAGGNVAVQVGPDGVLLVNTGAQESSSQVLAAIQKLTEQPIRYVINTNADADVVGGNAALSKAGQSLATPIRPAGRQVRVTGLNAFAPIVAHENVLRGMRAPGGQASPFPTDAWPSEPFNGRRKSFYFNGEGIEIVHQPRAHSDGDVLVFFRRSDVVAAGHLVDATRFPVIDVARGGSVQGELDALNRLIELAIPAGPHVGTPLDGNPTSPPAGGTEVVPGLGRIYRQIDLVNYRDMVVIIRDRIQHLISQKMTLDQIKAARPAKAYEPEYGATSGTWTTANFVEAVYTSLTKANSSQPER